MMPFWPLAGLLEPWWRHRARRIAGRVPMAEARFVVVDVETSGLDVRRDRLLSIGAVAVSGAAIRPAECIELILRQTEVSGHDNILVHGIAGGKQRTGVPADEAMQRFSAFVGNDTLVAYHADFDRLFLERAARDALGISPRWTWIDAAWLAPALLDHDSNSNNNGGHQRPLDSWCAALGITHVARHNALSDAFATAELLLILLERAARKRLQSVGDLQGCAEDERQLARMKPPVS